MTVVICVQGVPQYWGLIDIVKFRGVTIRRATIRYVSRYVVRDTANDTISDDTPTNLESQTHTSVNNAH